MKSRVGDVSCIARRKPRRATETAQHDFMGRAVAQWAAHAFAEKGRPIRTAPRTLQLARFADTDAS